MKRIIRRPSEAPLCACGCGLPAKWSALRPHHWNVYLHGHSNRGKLRPCLEETKRKIAKGNTGKKRTQAVKEQMSRTRLGRKAPPEWGRAISKAKKGVCTCTPEQSKAITESNRTRIVSEKTKERMRFASKDKPKSELHCLHVSQALRGKYIGPLCSAWKGGLSKIIYGIGFTGFVKGQVRKRDGYACRVCGDDPPKRLAVHHINYNKNDHRPENLILLCATCHTKTNFHRERWTKALERIT